jgi:hypothetical protein
MKTLFKKDLRENFKPALVALAILTLLLMSILRNCADAQSQAADGRASSVTELQPLLYGGLLFLTTFFCAIFGTLLGWLQARNEAHRDLWAFLIHRPATRTDIFWGKAAAGLCLYALGAGLPLLGMILFVRLPGHVAAPFEWRMVLPVTAIFLTGAAYYFAGLLIGLRQARWFGSRTFGLGTAIAASVAVNAAPEFWQALLVTLLLTATIALAAWGAYQSGGWYHGQPRMGKLALTASLTFGSFFLLISAVVLMGTLFSPHRQYYHARIYRVTRDGQIWMEVAKDGEESFTGLDGKLLLDPATGQKMDRGKFYEGTASSVLLNAGFARQEWPPNHYTSVGNYFTLWRVSDKNLWYVDRHGKLTGFNGVTRRHVGDLVPRNASGEDHFIRSGYWNDNYFNPFNSTSILATPNTVYRVDLDGRKLEPLFTAAPNDHVAGFAEFDPTNFVVSTRDTIRMVDFSGNVLLSLPYQPDPIAYPQIEVASLENSNKFAVLFVPDFMLNPKLNWKMAEHVVWISKAGKVAKTLNLPALHEPEHEAGLEIVLNRLMPPVLQLRFSLVDYHVRLAHWPCVIPAALCALTAWFFLRRYHFAGGAAAGWVLFVLLSGIPGLMAFFSAQEWPKREPCPGCKKLRMVDRETCEHCESPFPPPEKNGTEIFAPLAKA